MDVNHMEEFMASRGTNMEVHRRFFHLLHDGFHFIYTFFRSSSKLEILPSKTDLNSMKRRKKN